jgi:hypothetical protein
MDYPNGMVVRVAATTQKMEKKEAPNGMRWPWLATIHKQHDSVKHLYKVRWVKSQGPTTYDKPGIVAKRYFHAVQLKPATEIEQTQYARQPEDSTEEDMQEKTKSPRMQKTKTPSKRKREHKRKKHKKSKDAPRGAKRQKQETQQEPSAGETSADNASGEDSDADYEVDEVLDKRTTVGGLTEFHVKWKGYNTDSATWETEGNLHDCQDTLDRFEASQNKDSQCSQCQKLIQYTQFTLKECATCNKLVCFSAIDEDCCWRKPSQWYGDHDCGQCLDAAHQLAF